MRESGGIGGKQRILTGKVPENLLLSENGLKFRADVESGQKTGFFLISARTETS